MMSEHKFNVGDRVYMMGATRLNGIPDIQGPFTISAITPKRGDISLDGMAVKFAATGAEIGKGTTWHHRRFLEPADDPQVKERVNDALRQMNAQRIAGMVDMRGETVPDVRAFALSVVSACDEHLKRWPEDAEEADD